MKKYALLSILLAVFCGCATAQSIPPDSLYFGQTPPGSIPQVFAPGLVSLPNRNEAVITFSPDGASVFFYIQKYPQPGNPYTMYSEYVNNHWTTPDTIPFSYGRKTGEPFFAYGGNRVYMFATYAVNPSAACDLSYSEKQGANWSNPISMGNPPNSEVNQYHPCIVGDTSVYFSSNAGQICRSQYANGTYQTRVVLSKPVNFVGSQTWGDPFVSADESYMIFKSIRPEGFGQNDLYISYRRTDGKWTNPKNLGDIINTAGDETAGDITADGLYMTYGRNNDLYWVSSSFVDSMKYTNYIPYVMYPIPEQIAVRGQFYDYTVPDSTFVDDDGYSTLSFSSTLSNGNPLPAWLTFDPVNVSFSGTPDSLQVIYIKVTATDSAGASASSVFKLSVQPPVAIEGEHTGSGGLFIFPNPFENMVRISLPGSEDQTADLEISNMEGKIILRTSFTGNTLIDMGGSAKGIYIVKITIARKVLVGKICKS